MLKAAESKNDQALTKQVQHQTKTLRAVRSKNDQALTKQVQHQTKTVRAVRSKNQAVTKSNLVPDKDTEGCQK